MQSRLHFTLDYAALSDARLVIEAVVEDLNIKQAVFAKLNAICQTDTLLATNTSYLDPVLVSAPITDCSRFVGLHFFSPAHVMKLLEIIKIPQTSAQTLAAAYALAKLLHKIPVLSGISEGFIGNRILMRYRAEAEMMVREGVSIVDIDAAMRSFGFPMGPFEAQDISGLDIAFMQREAARENGNSVPETLADILVRAGRKGRKVGSGWYDYHVGERSSCISEATKRLIVSHVELKVVLPDHNAISARLVATMADEGHALLAEKVAQQPEDIDLVMIYGYGFPCHKGGPMYNHARGSISHTE